MERPQHPTDRSNTAAIARREEPLARDTSEIEAEMPVARGLTLFDSDANRSEPSELRMTQPVVKMPAYETWVLVLGTFTILATVALSFMIGSRIGWLSLSRRATPELPSSSQIAREDICPGTAAGCAAGQSSVASPAVSSKSFPARRTEGRVSAAAIKENPGARDNDELVVYEKGKVVFRMKPSSPQGDGADREAGNRDSGETTSHSVVQAASIRQIAAPGNLRANATEDNRAIGIWLSPSDADSRLLQRVEPRYPAEALAAHIAGDVVLKVWVSEKGTVSTVSAVTGDPILARAASEAVRRWRYKPYGPQGRLAPFETDVTLSFSLPQ
jgi:TonB family protein